MTERELQIPRRARDDMPFGLIDRLAKRAAESPDAVAVIETGGRTATRSDFVHRTRAIARGLAASGLEPGDRVLFAVRPSIDAIALIAAIIEAGGVVVPASIGAGDELFASQMRLIAPRWVVAESALLAAAGSPAIRRLARWRGASLPSLDCIRDATFLRVGAQWPTGPRAVSIDSIVKRGEGESSSEDAANRDENEALVVFTSGTTDAPKAVVHSRRSLAATLDVVAGQLAIGLDDALYARDLHLILPALIAGARVVIPRRLAFSPVRMLRDLERHRITHTFMVTGDCQALLDSLAARQRNVPATLRRLLIGAAPVRAAFLERLRLALPSGAEAWCVYGMTEILPVASISLEAKLAYTGDGDILGAAVPGVRARIDDSGELMLGGPHLFARYLGGPPVAEHATGDLARIDDGRIILLGRSKDMIIRREHNIYPELHEPIIEKIAGVRRCAMVGVYDEALSDERVVLVIEPEPGMTDTTLVDRVRTALQEGPTRIDEAAQPDLIIALELPVSGRSRKVDKAALRAIARARL